jgi:outer membrane lipoprotein-sorting protein
VHDIERQGRKNMNGSSIRAAAAAILLGTGCLAALGAQTSAPPAAGTSSQAGDQAGPRAAALLLAAEGQKNFGGSDYSCELELATTDGGGTTKASTMRLFRRDSKRQLVALVLSPASEKGEGYLRLDDNLWFFDAETGSYVHRVLSDAVGDSEMDSGDMEPDSYTETYRVSGMETGRLGANEVDILTLEEAGVQVYPRIRLWLRKSDALLLKEEYFGASGRLIRYVLYPNHVRVGGRTIASTAIYVDALDPARRTVVTVRSPSFAALPDYLFSKSFLERSH